MRNLSALLFVFVASLVATGTAAAQQYHPATIQFKGAPEYTDQELMAATGLKPRMALTMDELNERSQKLIDSGLFDNFTYHFDGQDLIFNLKPSTSIYPICLQNLPLMQGKELDAQLHDRIPLYHGKVPVSNGLAEQVRNALEEILAAQGLKATVEALASPDSAACHGATVLFTITSPLIQIGEIHIDSTSPALEPKAQEILTKLTGDPYDIEGSPRQIATYLGNYYRDKGYVEAAIVAAPQPAIATPEGAIQVPFQFSLVPGIQYKLDAMRLAPGLLVTQADFDHQANIHAGDIAEGQRLIPNWEFISRQYHNHGYMKASVHPGPAFDRNNGTVSYIVTVDPGPVFTMGTLAIENVAEDLRALMIAAWKMPAGTTFNESAVLNFYAAGDANPALKRVFSAVNCKYVLRLNDDTHTVDVTLRLEKKH